MLYHTKAKGFELSEAQQFLIEKNLRQINRLCQNFPEDLVQAQVVVSHHNPPGNFAAHLNLELPGTQLAAVASDFKFRLALNEAVKRIKKQIKTYKGHLQNRKDYTATAQANGKM